MSIILFIFVLNIKSMKLTLRKIKIDKKIGELEERTDKLETSLNNANILLSFFLKELSVTHEEKVVTLGEYIKLLSKKDDKDK